MLRFQAKLLNAKFDRENRNVLRFSNREEQQSYFDVASLFVDAPFVNFNAGSLMETTITYDCGEENINDILSKNYCIIKDNQPNGKLQYYYYHVTRSFHDSGPQIKVWLRLDIFQTYYIDCMFSTCHIKRAHLNRFVPSTDNKVKFDGTLQSKLFESEQINNLPKKLLQRNTYSLVSDRFGGGIVPSDISPTNLQFLDNYLLGWVYVYLNTSVTDKITLPKNRRLSEKIGDMAFPLPYICMAFPLFKDNKTIYVNMNAEYGNQTTYNWRFDNFISAVLGNIESYILDIRLSQVPPMPNFNLWDGYLVSDANTSAITITSQGETQQVYGEFYPIGRTSTESGYLTYIVYNHVIEKNSILNTGMNSRTITIPLEYVFEKTEIIGANKNKRFNPKLLGQDFTELRVGQGLGSPQNYDPQKMNSNNILMAWRESIVPGITRTYVSLLNDNDEESIYNSDTFRSLVGANISQDTSFPYSINQLEQYLANNKNFYQQNNANRITNVGQGLLTWGLHMASQNYAAAAGTGAGVVGSLIGSWLNEDYTVDNMSNAPETYVNLNGNPLLSLAINENRTYVEIWQALENELERANDYMCQYGFNVNLLGDIKQFDNIRKFYNYVSADVEEITGIEISNEVLDEFKRIFSRGVRFWNTDQFNYDKENYEIWLEEETTA